MALANYSDLQVSVAAFLHRADLASIIPDLITLAETRINGDLDARLQDTDTTITCVASTSTAALPTDAISVRTLNTTTTPSITLDYMTPDAMATAYAYNNEGTPQAYTIIGGNIKLAPIPDSAYVLSLVYKARVPSLAANTTNYLMTSYPNVYLYSTLCEAAPYIKDDSRVGLWEQKYKEAISTVNSQDWYSGSTMRVRVDTRP